MKQHLFESTASLCHCGGPPLKSSLGLENGPTRSWGREHEGGRQSLSSWPLVSAHGLRGRSRRPGLREPASPAALLLALFFVKEPGRFGHVWLRSIRHGTENSSAKYQRTSSRPPALSESRPDRHGERPQHKITCTSAFGIFHLAFDIYSLKVMLSGQLLDIASQQGKGLEVYCREQKCSDERVYQEKHPGGRVCI